MNAELEENKELAGNRLNELEELRQDLAEVTAQNEKLKVRCLRLFEDEGILCNRFPYVLLMLRLWMTLLMLWYSVLALQLGNVL